VKTFIKNAIAGLCFAALFLLVSASAQAQVLAHSGEIAGKVGYLNANWDSGHFLPSSNHAVYAINGGYNVTPHVTVMGEWAYGPLYSTGGDTIRAVSR
jgi:ABC-type proline/glycine betaine transport system substrate-binding protein